jgi:integrase
VDLDKATLTVPVSRMKAKIGHVIPLTDTAMDIIRNLPRFRRGDYMFTTSMGVKPMGGFDFRKKEFDAAIGGKITQHWVLHDLRRTCRTSMAAIGVMPFVAELVIGHTQRGIHAVYDLHRYDKEKRAALEAWEARLLSIVEPPPENVVALKRVRARL